MTNGTKIKTTNEASSTPLFFCSSSSIHTIKNKINVPPLVEYSVVNLPNRTLRTHYSWDAAIVLCFCCSQLNRSRHRQLLIRRPNRLNKRSVIIYHHSQTRVGDDTGKYWRSRRRRTIEERSRTKIRTITAAAEQQNK